MDKKKILFPLFGFFLAYLTVQLIGNLTNSTNHVFGIKESFFVAFLINLYVTGIFAMFGFAFSTSKLLPNTYYRIKNPKRLQLVYRLIGLTYFKVALLLFFWGSKKNKKKFFNGTKGGLQKFSYETHQAEFGHLAAFIFITLFSTLLLIKGYWVMLAFAMGINIVGNFYPIILQRYHRIRIAKLIN